MNSAALMLLVFLAAVVLSWLLTKRILLRWKKRMDPTERLLLGVCVFAGVFFVVAALSIGAASVYRHFAREVGSAISETVDAFEEAREETTGKLTEQTANVDVKSTHINQPVESHEEVEMDESDLETLEMSDAANETEAAPTAPVVEYPEGTTFTGTVVAFGSGSGFKLELEEGTSFWVRLAGMTAPERGQSYWNSARKALSARTLKKSVKVVTTVTSSGGEGVIGLAYLDEDCVNTWMVREGWAWYDPQHYESESLAKAQEEARTKKAGLWQQPDPLLPREWREFCNLDDSAQLARSEVYGMYYKEISVEDASIVALNFIRKRYKVFVRTGISERHLRAILLLAISNYMTANPDIDAIIVLAYEETEEEKRVIEFTPIGMVGWAPGRKWDNVSAEIARTNERSNYKYYVEISDEFRKTRNEDRSDE